MEKLPKEPLAVGFVILGLIYTTHFIHVLWFKTEQFQETARTVKGWRKVAFYVFYRYSGDPLYLPMMRVGSLIFFTILSALLILIVLLLLKKYTGFDPLSLNPVQ